MGQKLLSIKDKNGRLIKLETDYFRVIKISVNDGKITDSFISDPGIIKASGIKQSV
ncbi:hypothetical protein ACWGOQ_0018625 [Aquimarina sp. M1]